jgi:hypothetical protein
MPIIGSLVQQRLENTLDDALSKLWVIRQPASTKNAFCESKASGKVDVEDVVFAREGEVPGLDLAARLDAVELEEAAPVGVVAA